MMMLTCLPVKQCYCFVKSIKTKKENALRSITLCTSASQTKYIIYKIVNGKFEMFANIYILDYDHLTVLHHLT